MKRMMLVVLAMLLGLSVGLARGQVVSTRSLLEEMTDRHALARWPSPEYESLQSSSYDRASVRAGEESWFANNDAGNFVRVEERQGRREHVMLDAAGPGAVVRIWSANPRGTMRVYVDDRPVPVIEGPMERLLDTGGLAPEPLAGVRARGYNVFLPIPFARRCVITSDEGGFYYIINHRRYADGTIVESIKPGIDAMTDAAIRDAAARLLEADARPETGAVERSIDAGGVLEHSFARGPAALSLLRLRVEADESEMEQALRSLVVEMSFDGEQTVWAPAGDLFGSGIGLHVFEDWMRSVRADGTMELRWVMPYRSDAKIVLRNVGERTVDVRLGWREQRWAWDDRSMYFHARWRESREMSTRPMSDWNFNTIQGRGVLVGDSLTITNPVEAWWGEGDEKITIDGAGFPQHFGTGTEDYYGYAWCCPDPFQSAFHAQVRSDGHAYGNNYGTSTVARVRSLDAIPFRSSLKFDMEVWHWSDTRVSQSAVTYYYAMSGAKSVVGADVEAARRAVPRAPALPPPLVIEGAIEAESMRVVRASEGLGLGAQGGFGPSLWSRGQQLWVRGEKKGDFVELAVPARGRKRVLMYATRSWDYGVVAVSVNGRVAVGELDLFNAAARAVASTGPIDLGVHEATGEGLLVRVEVVGSHAKSEGSGSYFGIDCFVLEDER